MPNRTRRRKIFWFLFPFLQLVISDDKTVGLRDPDENEPKNLKNIYVPRMDYDQWKPLGRGDPLKNDPTYDYVPPVLDRVQYWIDPAMRKPDAPAPGETQKTEILLLGVTSRKPASPAAQADSRKDTYDSYVKYVDGGSKYHNSNQRLSRPSFMQSSFLPSFFPQNKNKYMDRTHFSKGTEQRVPYTMLVPPPLEQRPSPNALSNSPLSFATQAPILFPSSSSTSTKSVFPSSTASSVTLQSANLVYHSSSSQKDYRDATIAPSISWEQHSSTDTDATDYRDEVVFSTHLTLPESYMRIEFHPRSNKTAPLIASDSNHNINYVTPPPLLNTPQKEVMFKGQVTDDNLDISNTYVKIGKPEAEVHSTGLSMTNIPVMGVMTHPLRPPNMVVFPHSMKPSILPVTNEFSPLTMQKLQEMQTMLPPPVTPSSLPGTKNPLLELLDREKAASEIREVRSTTPSSFDFMSNVSQTTTTEISTTTTTEKVTTTENPEPPTTTASALTTDPLFKHYKQPMEPVKGPLYLIIQGHSKVKTYGPGKQMHGISIQDTNEIPDNEDKFGGHTFEVRHLHGFGKDTLVEDRHRRGRSGNIQTLKHVIQTGLGAVDLTDIEEIVDRNDSNLQETELEVGYEVVEDKDATERYHKGVVEEARKLNV